MEKNVELKIEGMHCQSCEALISEELRNVPGVEEVVVSYTEGKAKVAADLTRVTDKDLVAAVSRAGYAAEVVSSSQLKEPLDMEVTVREAETGEPVSLKIDSSTEAEGRVLRDDRGKSYFEGKLKNRKTAEIKLPKGQEASKSHWVELFRSARFFNNSL